MPTLQLANPKKPPMPPFGKCMPISDKSNQHPDGFFARIADALGEDPAKLARRFGVRDKAEIERLIKAPRPCINDVDMDPLWWELNQECLKKIGLLTAIRFELNKALQGQLVSRVMRAARTRERRDRRT